MAESTTTNDTTLTGAEALPVDGTQTVAEQPPAEPTGEQAPAETPSGEQPTSTEEGDQASLPTQNDVDEKLKSFAKGQGIDDVSELSDRERSLLKAAYDNKAAADRNFQRSNELEKATNINDDQVAQDATPEERENVRLRNIELRMEIQGWKLQNPDKTALEGEMVKILADPNKKALVQGGYLSLDDVYSLAKASAPDNSEQVKSQAKREALESLAHKQQAAVPTGSATNPGTAPKEKPFEELSIAEMEQKLGFVRH